MAWVTPVVRATGDLITAAIWNQDVVYNPSYTFSQLIESRPTCVVRRTSSQSLGLGTNIINWQAEDVDNFNGWNSGAPGQIGVTEIGWYLVWASLSISAGATSTAYVDLNSTTQILWSTNTAQGAMGEGHSLAGVFVLGPSGRQEVRVKVIISAAGESVLAGSTFGVTYLWD